MTTLPQMGLVGVVYTSVGLPLDNAAGGLRDDANGSTVNGFNATASIQLFSPLIAEATSPLLLPDCAGKLMLASPV